MRAGHEERNEILRERCRKLRMSVEETVVGGEDGDWLGEEIDEEDADRMEKVV